MESPRKFNDCYFYYYSTCTKGDNCVFRHEPSALGCETMCTAWQEGKCLDKRCKLRHMELRKNRKQIPCYWENQPGGCRKIHCPFMHKNPEARTDGIAPSQPAPPMPHPGLQQMAGPMALNPEPLGAEPPLSALPAPQPVPAPVPLLWQQQRQAEHLGGVMLESGVLVPGAELRRLPPYAPLPVDPLVVNFEEESDNESAPSTTPTKDEANIARTKSQELLALEKIQAEAAAFYNYDALPPIESKERKIVRSNLSTKYDRVSLDEISGKKPVSQERRKSLDFKVLSLDEIRARKKNETHVQPITLNLRKRKLSTQETLTTTGNKILKVVSSNSIVYKKLDKDAPTTSQTKVEVKTKNESRKRTISEQSDIYEVQDNELIDCYEFKRIKIIDQSTQNKPRLIRNRNVSESKSNDIVSNNIDNDSDNEVQIIGEEISSSIDLDSIYNDDVIDVDTTKICEPIELSDDDDVDSELVNNVPDVVASCQKKDDKGLMKDIDALIGDEL